jgi:hypothetical protein
MSYLVFSSFDFDDDETIIDQLITKRNGVVVAKVPDDMFLVFELSRSKLRCFELVPFIDMPVIKFLRDESMDMRKISAALKTMRQEQDKQEG